MLVTLRGVFRENISKLRLGKGSNSTPATPSTSQLQASSSELVSVCADGVCTSSDEGEREQKMIQCVRLRYNVPLDPENEDVEDFDVEEILALLDLLESHVRRYCCTRSPGLDHVSPSCACRLPVRPCAQPGNAAHANEWTAIVLIKPRTAQ